MKQKNKLITGLFCTGVILLLFSCVHARPPKPGPNFIWIKAHTTPAGITIPGHWQYTGAALKGKVWVPGHYNPAGKFIAGHWKIIKVPHKKRGRSWAPGHYNRRGRWIPGHWR